MNFIQILKKLEAYSLSLPYVNSTNTGDIYEFLNGNPGVKYASVNIDINLSTRNDNLINYSVYLYYVDRLTEDKRNWKEVKTTAEQVLNSIINYAANELGDVIDGWVINYFEQLFADNCAGGWVNFNLEVPSVLGDCLIDEYEDDDTTEQSIPTVLVLTKSQFDALEEREQYTVYNVVSNTGKLEAVWIGTSCVWVPIID